MAGLLAAVTLIGCEPSTPAGTPMAKRTTIVPAPGVFGFQFSKQGRLAYSTLVDSAAAIIVADADGSNKRRVSFGVWDTTPFWSPDGKSVAFVRDAGGQNDVLIVPSDSGAERPVAATPSSETVNGWLPDGSGLLFSRSTIRGLETWLYNVADGSSTKLIDVEGSVDAYVSPDGKWFAYTLSRDGKSTVWLYDREKKTQRQLTTEGFESVGFHGFSPDSRSLLFNSRRTGTFDIWRLDIATGERKQVTQDIAEDGNASWSPDGSRILFASNRGGQPDLWVITSSEADVVRLTDDANFDVADANWTPDGSAVVASVGLGLPHLYSVPIDGSPARALTSGNWADSNGEVSPDGRQVVFTSTKNGDDDVWIVPVAGGEPKLVSGAPGIDGNASWAPDNKRVAFTSLRSGNPDIWIAPVDSGPAVRLTDWPSAESAPRWSPDGRTIAFLSVRESSGNDLWTMPADGGPAKRLTRVGTVRTLRWSPDGKSIAYAAQVESAGGQAVFIIPAAGGEARRLSPPTSLNMDWRPDGREIKVMQCEQGFCTVDIWSPDGKRLRTLSLAKSVYEFDTQWSTDGTQMLVTWQDFRHDGGTRVDLRPAAGGSAKPLARPDGFTMLGLGFADSNRTAIVMGTLYGTALQRIPVPAPAR